MKRVAAFAVLALACAETRGRGRALATWSLRAAKTFTVDATPDQRSLPRGKRSAAISSSKLVYAKLPVTLANRSRPTSTAFSTGTPVPIHQATWRPPFDPRAAGGWGFTWLHS